MADPDDVRHGVFLLPDARTSAAVTRITAYLRAQLGVVPAGRFPPHITLAGSLPLAVPETALLTAVRDVAARYDAVTVSNAGPRRLWGSVLAFDVHEDGQGQPNDALVDLAVAVMDAVRPLLRPAGHLVADLHERADWHGHVSLASHEVLERPHLLRQVDQLVRQLDEPYPATFEGSDLGVFRFHHRDWDGAWWTDFSYELVDVVELGVCPGP